MLGLSLFLDLIYPDFVSLTVFHPKDRKKAVVSASYNCYYDY